MNRLIIITALTLLFVSGEAFADWPAWRHDAGRTGASSEDAPADANLIWQLDLGQPEPAYDHQFRMCADRGPAPVATGGTVFIPSGTSDQVMACSLATGRVLWRFVTEGPVRFAPVVANGNVIFGCDDGYVYAVAADSGELAWKVRGVEPGVPDHRLLLNDRLGSRWPVRGAPVVHGDRVFFGAGIWPEEGVYVVAADLTTGKVLWRNDALSFVKKGMSDHGKAYNLGLPPHGYLAIIDGKLAVPSARSLAAWFDPETGEMEPYTSFYVKSAPPRGTWSVYGVNQLAVQGGNWFATRAEAKPPLPQELENVPPPVAWSRVPEPHEEYVLKHRPFLRADMIRVHNENAYTDPVLTEDTAFIAEFATTEQYSIPRGHTAVRTRRFDRIVARDLTRPRWGTAKQQFKYNASLPRDSIMDAPVLEYPVLWELESPLKVLIKAGRYLIVGGENQVAAIAIPGPGEKPRIAWEAPVAGSAIGALVCDGTLVVTTDVGRVYGFGDGPTLHPAVLQSAFGAPQVPEQGYALVVGWNDGGRARQLAREQYRVVVIEPDESRASSARNELANEGLLGRHVQVLNRGPDEISLAPYWASLVVLHDADYLNAALQALRPYNGRLELRGTDLGRSDSENVLQGRTGYVVAEKQGSLEVHRTTPPRGSADWTHEMGGAGNEYANADQLVKWPLGVLWFSGEIDRFFTPATHFQHERNPRPTVSHGRMFLITGQHLHAIDAYTGRYLWKATMPMTPWVRTWYLDSRKSGRPIDRSYLASKDLVYVITGEDILTWDAATGEQQATITIPEDLADAVRDNPLAPKIIGRRGEEIQTAPEWIETRLWNDFLVAMLGRNLTALDRRSGDVQWLRGSTRNASTYAIGSDVLVGMDYEPTRPGQKLRAEAGRLFALDPRTGKERWSKEVDYGGGPGEPAKLDRPWNPLSAPTVAFNRKHRLIILNVNANDVRAYNADDGKLVWQRTVQESNFTRSYSVVMEDAVMIGGVNGLAGYLFDIRTGKELGSHTGIPRPRSCSRVFGNSCLLAYRDAATELYDVKGNRMIEFNAMRSGCVTSFFPAGGIMNAPMLGHGCVCNYPMFNSLALVHTPGLDELRPERVTSSWENELQAAVAANPATPTKKTDVKPVDLTPYTFLSAVADPAEPGLMLRSDGKRPGFAIRPLPKPVQKQTFTFTVEHVKESGRHGNAFFVLGGAQPESWIECRYHYGGKKKLSIAGALVEPAEITGEFQRSTIKKVNVEVDLITKEVTVRTGGKTLTTSIAGDLEQITHIGYGGSNFANRFTPAELE
ncbi:MAG: PQQ-binding-like beta-propeller repeat protein [Fuerstiella sp.]|nr:PQQ-binding-like beta-propeller repeat protein [Fuerstiella sp.]MCP4857519.1 PQQ-binding-like beta-propeller repeat protein [Fuerstiella sp.]